MGDLYTHAFGGAFLRVRPLLDNPSGAGYLTNRETFP